MRTGASRVSQDTMDRWVNRYVDSEHEKQGRCQSCGASGWKNTITPAGTLAVCRCRDCNYWSEMLAARQMLAGKDAF